MNIRQLREKRGIRQEDIATQLKIDRSTVAKWETGEAMPRSDKLPDLAKILRCSIADLF